MSTPRPDILVVEDDRRLCAALEMLLANEPFALRFAHTARAAAQELACAPPRAAVVDLGLPDRSGLEVIAELIARLPKLPVLALTSATGEDAIVAALRGGACGYLLKEDVGTKLAPALRELLQGGTPMSAQVGRFLIDQLRQRTPVPDPAEAPPAQLTTREREILEQLASDGSYERVAAKLGISVNTVRAHVRTLYEKLEVRTRADALLVGLRTGLIKR